MVWEGKHHSLLAAARHDGPVRGGVHVQQVVQHERLAARLRGRRRAAIADAIGKMINTTLSCVPPIVQLAGTAALQNDDTPSATRSMQQFREKVELLIDGPEPDRRRSRRSIPAATFYVFPNVAPICNRLGITSHGLAMYLLEGADDKFGVACLGGECFGEAGAGLPALQLRRAERPPAAGARLPPEGDRAHRPRGGVARQAPAVPARKAVRDRINQNSRTFVSSPL